MVCENIEHLYMRTRRLCFWGSLDFTWWLSSGFWDCWKAASMRERERVQIYGQGKVAPLARFHASRGLINWFLFCDTSTNRLENFVCWSWHLFLIQKFYCSSKLDFCCCYATNLHFAGVLCSVVFLLFKRMYKVVCCLQVIGPCWRRVSNLKLLLHIISSF